MTSPADPFSRTFNFGYGESYEQYVIPSAGLERTPDTPGLYSWHIRLPRNKPEKAASFLHALFHDASLFIEATGNMRQVWSGEVINRVNAFEKPISQALPAAFFSIAYPLYIGISRSLRQRLLTHFRQLERYKDNPPSELVDRGEDDEQESRYFGQRLGAAFKKADFHDTGRLFVKCISWPIRSSDHARGEADINKIMSELRAAEEACNSLFHPVFGRR